MDLKLGKLLSSKGMMSGMKSMFRKVISSVPQGGIRGQQIVIKIIKISLGEYSEIIDEVQSMKP